MSRAGISGPPASLTTGMAFGGPPILKACIAIIEPDAGGDLANITTTAAKSPCCKYYIVSGAKKWITNGVCADYSSMAVRTGLPRLGAAGLSLLVVPLKNFPGVTIDHLKVAGQVYAGSAFIELDDVKVPVENPIGIEVMGMKYIMTNFNHERLYIAVDATRLTRAVLLAVTIVDQLVIRHRLAKAGGLLESQWAWVEQFAYQMTQMPMDDADRELGGMTSLLKARAGIVFVNALIRPFFYLKATATSITARAD
ncbi:hypothetical protein NUW58_g2378 [Xylaria curta]|uniref:Uncharacterized protein n=1 Tax=Xylaria curta TaxID=42375 RepID=A0ACC1PFV0_9PEZI|nr:hypothetical protein NUW58_g2378 [Xylaria curta]